MADVIKLQHLNGLSDLDYANEGYSGSTDTVELAHVRRLDEVESHFPAILLRLVMFLLGFALMAVSSKCVSCVL